MESTQSTTAAADVVVTSLSPMMWNYGNVLQSYALQRSIRSLGLRVLSTNQTLAEPSAWRTVLRLVKDFVLRVRGKRRPTRLSARDQRIASRNLISFVDKQIDTVDLWGMRDEQRSRFLGSLQAIVVGSDQVWRPNFNVLPRFLLDYAVDCDLTRISYAASFGVEELPEGFSARTKTLASKFDAMTVREQSAVKLCLDEWGIRADVHLDPTMLLTSSDYQQMVAEAAGDTVPSEGEIFVYILDPSASTAVFVEEAARRYRMRPFGILPPEPSSVRDFRANARRYQLPPVEQWIRSFMDAEIVITDSFHGTVFSIIFNKPFICIGNESRGNTRFSSLNEIFGLSDQFISSARDLPEVVPIPEWGAINREICRRRERAMSYLRQHLL